MAKRKAGETEFVHDLDQPRTKVQILNFRIKKTRLKTNYSINIR